MLLFAISGFINAFFGLVFIFFIFSKYKKEKIYYLFYLLNFSLVMWSIPYGFWQLSIDYDSALFWARMLSLGSTIIPLFYFHFTLALLDIEKKKILILIFAYFETFVYLIFGFSKYFIRTVEPTFEFSFWPKPGFLYIIYLIFSFFGLLIYSNYLLFKNYSEAVGIKKQQIKYAWFAYLLPIVGGSTNFPYWFGIKIPPYGTFFGFVYPLAMGYVLSTYRLLDIRFVLGKIFTYLFSIVSIIVSAFFLFYALQRIQGLIYIQILYFIILVICIFLYNFYFNLFKKLASNIFYYKIYSFQTIISDLGRRLVSVLDLDRLYSLILQTTTKEIGVDQSALFIRNVKTKTYKLEKNVGFNEENIKLLLNDQNFIKFIEEKKRALLFGEIVEKISSTNTSLLTKNSQGELCLPLISENIVVGCIILGKKVSGDTYSVQDIDLLSTLANQISIALENARLYDQVQDLSENLQQKVDEQTKELKQAYQTEKTAREELEKLDTTKNQFLLATQHHLRTPLTAMKWSADLMLKRKLDKRSKIAIQGFKTSTEKLIKMVNEFLDITQFQLGKNLAYVKSEVELQGVVREIIEELEFEKKSKKIYLNLEAFDDSDIILADRGKIKMAIFNIIDNAVKYTNTGGVTVFIEKNINNVILKVKDTGIGISLDNQKNMFNKVFERGLEAQKTFATGRGIGLYIASQIIKAHNGRIFAESQGEGKGLTITIELPAK